MTLELWADHGRTEPCCVAVPEAEVERESADEIDEDFFVYITAARPFVTWKWATSRDGRIVTRSGASRCIIGEAARRVGHRLRRRVGDDLMVTGRLAPKAKP